MDDEFYALISQLKCSYDNAVRKIEELEADRNELAAILQKNSIQIPAKICEHIQFDEECKLPLE